MSLTDDSIAWELMHEYGFYPLKNTKYESDPYAEGQRTFFFANVSNDLKCLIQFDSDELDLSYG